MFPVYIKFASELSAAGSAVLSESKVRKLDFVEDSLKESADAYATAELKISLSGVKSKNVANRFFQKTLESCLLLNSVSTEKHFQFDIYT